MAEIIYSRVSTTTQETANQLHSMRAKYPDAAVVEETASGAKSRPELDALLNRLRPGDTLVVYALDRLGRRCGELVTLLDRLNREGIILVSLREGIDLGTLGGRFVAQIFAALAELERGIIGERTKSALAAKKASGMRLGAAPKIPVAVRTEVLQLRSTGATFQTIAKRFGLSTSTIHSICKKEAI